MLVERQEKNGGSVRGGDGSEADVAVGVPLEVRLHRFKKFKMAVGPHRLKKNLNGGRESVKIPRVGYARRGIRI